MTEQGAADCSHSSWTIARGILVGGFLLFLAILLLVVLYQLFTLLVIILLGLMLAQAIGPAVSSMESRRVPRPIGVLMIYLVLIAVIVSLGWSVIPPLARDLSVFVAAIPNYLEELLLWVEPIRQLLVEFDLVEDLEEGLRQVALDLARSLGALVALPVAILGGIVSIFSIFVFAFLFSVSGDTMGRFFLALIHPDQRRETQRVMDHMGARLGAYVRSTLTLMTAVGLLTYLGLVVLGVPFPHLLAILAFFTEVIPMVGPFVGAAPAVLVALFISPILAIQVVVLYILVQQVESYLLAPIVHGRQLVMSPMLVLTSILVAGALFGILGALIAVPLAALSQVLVEDVIVPWRQRQIEPESELKEESPAPPEDS